jgi:hypothetical protein
MFWISTRSHTGAGTNMWWMILKNAIDCPLWTNFGGSLVELVHHDII